MSVVLIIITGDSLVLGDARRDPLTRTEVLALVAGGVFSKIVVHAIELHGLALTVDDNFNSLATAFPNIRRIKISAITKPAADLAALIDVELSSSLVAPSLSPEWIRLRRCCKGLPDKINNDLLPARP